MEKSLERRVVHQIGYWLKGISAAQFFLANFVRICFSHATFCARSIRAASRPGLTTDSPKLDRQLASLPRIP